MRNTLQVWDRRYKVSKQSTIVHTRTQQVETAILSTPSPSQPYLLCHFFLLHSPQHSAELRLLARDCCSYPRSASLVPDFHSISKHPPPSVAFPRPVVASRFPCPLASKSPAGANREPSIACMPSMRARRLPMPLAADRRSSKNCLPRSSGRLYCTFGA